MANSSGDSGQKLTRTDLTQGISLATDQEHALMVPYEDVAIEIEWPAHVAQFLPDDFQLTLSCPDLDDQVVKAAAAEWTEEGAVRFSFGWRKKTRSITLTAAGGGSTVKLWDGQVPGDLDTMIDWEAQLKSLLLANDDADGFVTQPTEADRIPPDLHYDDMAKMVEDL